MVFSSFQLPVLVELILKNFLSRIVRVTLTLTSHDPTFVSLTWHAADGPSLDSSLYGGITVSL